LSLSAARRTLSTLAVAGCLLLAAGTGHALGPFSHLTLASRVWPQLAAEHGLDRRSQELAAALYAGCLAPDAGYYPGADSRLAEAAHLVRPWQLVAALLELAASDRETAFALGWLSHALLDLRGHAGLVNPLAGGVYQETRLAHKEIEWGMDCWLLAQPQGAPLWRVRVDASAGLELWQRAMAKAYGGAPSLEVMLAAQQAQLREVDRLPYVWWLSGRLTRPGRSLGNGVGWVLGRTLRPAYLAWLSWTDGDMEVRGVLGARWPDTEVVVRLDALMARVAAELGRAAKGRVGLSGSWDADPACDAGDCPQAAAAKAWLEKLAQGGRATEGERP